MTRIMLNVDNVHRLANNEKLREAFPFFQRIDVNMKPVSVPKTGCTSCQKKSAEAQRRTQQNLLTSVLISILALNKQDKERLKSVLGVEQIVLYLTAPGYPTRTVL